MAGPLNVIGTVVFQLALLCSVPPLNVRLEELLVLAMPLPPMESRPLPERFSVPPVEDCPS